MKQHLKIRGGKAGTAFALALAVVTLSACDNLLEVTLPAKLTDAALEDPKSAVAIRNSAIGEFETAYDYLVWQWYSREDAGGTALGSAGVVADGVNFDVGIGSVFQPLATSRSFAYALHDKLANDKGWAAVPDRQQIMAVSSIYAGASLSVMGSSLCEVTIDGGKKLTPNETLTLADEWLTKALSEITTDFAVPYGIASSAKAMAYGLRAQVRWMKGDNAGALADAAQVPKGFIAYATRDIGGSAKSATGGVSRQNRSWNDGPNGRYSRLNGVVDWWTGSPNPVTGKAWPKGIPFTGYTEMGIAADGRAVTDDGYPIRRATSTAFPGVDATAVVDPRIPFIKGTLTGGGATIEYIHNRYPQEGDDLPMVDWKDMWLMRAEIEGGQKAIDYVNDIRADKNLPKVTYAVPTNTTQIRYMIIEERRRALFLEGRYFFTKLKNLDLLFFPRAEGRNANRGNAVYSGGIRMIMPANEYTLNKNLTDADRGTGCAVPERPININ
jgi:hypothetical protein